MEHIAAIYTGMRNLPATIERLVGEQVGGLKYNHILDSGLMRDIIAAGGVTASTERRALALFEAAVGCGADLVLCTCSSIGDVADKAGKLYPKSSILRIDYAMAEHAVSNYRHIAVLGTLETTIGPSRGLVERVAAAAGVSVQVTSAVAEGAYAATVAGDGDQALAMIKDAAAALTGGAEVLLLAQASMGVHSEALRQCTGLPVLNSPELCAAYIKRHCAR